MSQSLNGYLNGGSSVITPQVTINGNTGVITNVGSGPFGMGQRPVPKNGDLPTFQLLGHDEAENKVYMTLEPERTISAYEVMQITMMLMAYCDDSVFCPYRFVKENNLERHFKFS